MSSRNYRFTHNNYDGTYVEDNVNCRYIIYGKEIAPTTGTPHLQGVIVLHDKVRESAVRKLLPGCHIDRCDALEAAIEYCKKDGDWTERGDCPMKPKEKGAGEKRRWSEIRVAAEEGRWDDLPDDIRYKNLKLNKMHWCEALRSRELQDTEEVHLWYWGAAGTGKSRKAREENPGAYLKMCNKWWCGYTDEDVVIIEDFDKKHEVLGHHCKIWADRYPFLAELKGDTMKIRPKKIIVTSNYHPREIWFDESDLEPILRRFKCIEFKKLGSS